MAMGRREPKQQSFWIEASEIVRGEGERFYEQLNRLLNAHEFDEFVEELVERGELFREGGRPSLPPGVFFRMLLAGYFEGVSSERGIAWRCADSLSLRRFLGYELTEETPDHSTVSLWRRRMPASMHREVFNWIVDVARQEGLVRGRKVAVDSTTLEANASMKRIARRVDGKSWEHYVKELAKEEGIDKPTARDGSRVDRRRKGKRVSNSEWKSPTDEDARIAKMKDGRTRLAYKAENAVDVESSVILASEIHAADQADASTILATTESVDERRDAMGIEGQVEYIGDRGYHSDDVVATLHERGHGACIADPQRGRRNWKRMEGRLGKKEMRRRRKAFYRNRRRVRSAMGRSLQKKRAEYPERTFAHLCRTGGFRRVWVRGRENVQKRIHLHAGAANLGAILRKMIGAGTPRELALAVLRLIMLLLTWPTTALDRARGLATQHSATTHQRASLPPYGWERAFSTGS